MSPLLSPRFSFVPLLCDIGSQLCGLRDNVALGAINVNYTARDISSVSSSSTGRL
jgi:hypothetical protein